MTELDLALALVRRDRVPAVRNDDDLLTLHRVTKRVPFAARALRAMPVQAPTELVRVENDARVSATHDTRRARGRRGCRANVMRLCAVLACLAPALAVASPNVEIDDPRYDELAMYAARGLLPLHRGGSTPLTEARMRTLLVRAPLPRGGWFRLDRGLLRIDADDDRPRQYSSFDRPRSIAGQVAFSCERNVGRPCIGIGSLAEIDGSVGYADYVSGTLRLRANAGTEGYDAALAIDRLYALSTVGPVSFEIGRDALVLGPRSRTQLGWGEHAPALDHIRASTSEPFRLTDSLAANVIYAAARLRSPQTFEGSVMTISRVQMDIVDRLEIGLQQQLVLGGDGAPPVGGLTGFVLEHLARRDKSAGDTDSSNRRFGGDLAWVIPEFRGARLYYQVMFEDIRRTRFVDAVRYDADHLFGVEVAALGRHGVTVEYHQTGVRSQEHTPRITGTTNAGRVGGSPLGPDAKSFYVGSRLDLERVVVYPWFERASLASDEYTFVVDGPITLSKVGRKEFRTRVGSRARLPLSRGFSLEANTALEHVSNFGFQRGTTRWNGRIALDLVWRNPN